MAIDPSDRQRDAHRVVWSTLAPNPGPWPQATPVAEVKPAGWE